MGLTTDPNNPDLNKPGPDGQNKMYLILSAEERAKGFVRPVRRSYCHVGIRPKYPIRDLTEEEKARYAQFGYVKFEEYPVSESSSLVGRYWTQEQLNSGCRAVTYMSQELAETYARNPKFYGATFCSNCKRHFPVEEFVWDTTNEIVGS